MTKTLRFIAIAIAVVLVTGTVLMLRQPKLAAARTPVNSLGERQVQLTTNAEAVAMSTLVPERSGYWVQVTRRASVRKYPGGPEVRPGFRLEPGQYFHVDPKGGDAHWSLGFACPNGGRYCNSRENLPGFTLRSALGAQVSANPAETSADSTLLAFSEAETDATPVQGGARYMPALFHSFAAGTNAVSFAAATRRVCAREVWLRDNRLHPIGILYAGDRFDVERYTDGSGNNGHQVWAIGRAYGPGVKPQGKHGRVMANSLCP